MEITQVFIILSLSIISVGFIICVYYLVTLAKELKTIITKTSAILDDTRQITGSISRPVSSLSEFLMGFKNGFHLFNSFFNKEDKKT